MTATGDEEGGEDAGPVPVKGVAICVFSTCWLARLDEVPVLEVRLSVMAIVTAQSTGDGGVSGPR